MADIAPVAFIIFNRPDLAAKVFAAIRQARPSKLFLIADGPRPNKPGEAEKCAAARAVVEKVDWPCEVMRNYSEVNLGCGRRPATGISWVFSQVEEAIILEDDCVPNEGFFTYCTTLLSKYHDDTRVMSIAGSKLHHGGPWTPYSYYFSKYPLVWGWATWRRAWKFFDIEIKSWPDFQRSNGLRSVCTNPEEYLMWEKNFNRTYNGEFKSVWDFQWLYACWSHAGMAIAPEQNLISNIGFGADATHTLGHSEVSNLPNQDIGVLRHPTLVFQNTVADAFAFRKIYAKMGTSKPLARYRRVREYASRVKAKLMTRAPE